MVKIWKQGGRDLSYGMLVVYLLGVTLWLGYGLLVRAWAVILTNAATAILIAIATGLKAWTAKRDLVKGTSGVVNRQRLSGSWEMWMRAGMSRHGDGSITLAAGVANWAQQHYKNKH
jgi:MtN3 and saliva related transmembrane protein